MWHRFSPKKSSREISMRSSCPNIHLLQAACNEKTSTSSRMEDLFFLLQTSSTIPLKRLVDRFRHPYKLSTTHTDNFFTYSLPVDKFIPQGKGVVDKIFKALHRLGYFDMIIVFSLLITRMTKYVYPQFVDSLWVTYSEAL